MLKILIHFYSHLLLLSLAFGKAGAGTIAEDLYGKVWACVSAWFWHSARFGLLERIIQCIWRNHTATILTVLQSAKAWYPKFHSFKSMRMQIVARIFRPKTHLHEPFFWLSNHSRRYALFLKSFYTGLCHCLPIINAIPFRRSILFGNRECDRRHRGLW